MIVLDGFLPRVDEDARTDEPEAAPEVVMSDQEQERVLAELIDLIERSLQPAPASGADGPPADDPPR